MRAKVWDTGRCCIWDNWGENQDCIGEEKRRRREEEISKIGDEHIVRLNTVVNGAGVNNVVL